MTDGGNEGGDSDEVSQEENEQDEVDGIKNGADSMVR